MKTPAPHLPAIVRAMHLYPGRERDFLEAVRLHTMYGYVVAAPHLFALARPVLASAPPEELENLRADFAHPDAWLIGCAAGELRHLAKLLPFHLPRLGFQRRAGATRYRWYETDRLLARCASSGSIKSMQSISSIL